MPQERLSYCWVNWMKKHRNIPFFVPHAGCPNCCVFCSQTKITGQKAEKDLETELSELKELLGSLEKEGFAESQLAFFGGSFTAIKKERMVALLSAAQEYINRGVVESIRISTRPDCINSEILEILKEYNVTHIELGVQSTNNAVLNASSRGHKAIDSFNAARLITESGFVFGGQMMIGLPGSDVESEVQTALNIVKMGAKEARIYPTVVFEETKLFDMAVNNEYLPLTLENAVERTAKCYRIFEEAGLNVLRVGLHASENLKNAPLGANHPALGELVKSRVYTDIIAENCGDCKDKILSVGIRKEDISMLCGHKGSAINRLKAETGATEVEIYSADVDRFRPLIKTRSV